MAVLEPCQCIGGGGNASQSSEVQFDGTSQQIRCLPAGWTNGDDLNQVLAAIASAFNDATPETLTGTDDPNVVPPACSKIGDIYLRDNGEIYVMDALGGWIQLTVSATPDHNDLLGLQGGTLTERFHLTEGERDSVNSAVQSVTGPLIDNTDPQNPITLIPSWQETLDQDNVMTGVNQPIIQTNSASNTGYTRNAISPVSGGDWVRDLTTFRHDGVAVFRQGIVGNSTIPDRGFIGGNSAPQLNGIQYDFSTDNVGLGVSGPSHKLDVNGELRVRNIQNEPGGFLTTDVDGVVHQRTPGQVANDIGAVTSIPDHNDLNGLQGGSATERYHLTESDHDNVVNLSPVATSGMAIDVTYNDGGSGFGGNVQEALDNVYDNGTWTPTFIGSASGSQAVANQAYTRVGNMVTLHLALSGIDLTALSGDITISGLPLPVETGVPVTGSVINSGQLTYPAGRSRLNVVAGGGQDVGFSFSGDGVTSVGLTDSEIAGASVEFVFSITYRTSSF